MRLAYLTRTHIVAYWTHNMLELIAQPNALQEVQCYMYEWQSYGHSVVSLLTVDLPRMDTNCMST